MKKLFFVLAIALLSSCVFAAPPGKHPVSVGGPGSENVSSFVPQLISVQGLLANATTGAAVDNGNYVMNFSIWSAATGGFMLWSEVQSVQVSNGYFDVILGSTGALGYNCIEDSYNGDLFTEVLCAQYMSADNVSRLEVKIGTEVLSPRYNMTTAPFSYISDLAMNAISAQSVETVYDLEEVTGLGKWTDRGIDINSTNTPGLNSTTTNVFSSGPAIYGRNDNGGGYGVQGIAASGYGVYGNSSSGTGVFAEGNYGVQATSPAVGGRGVYATTSGASSYGVYSQANGFNNFGVYSVASALGGVGVYGSGDLSGVNASSGGGSAFYGTGYMGINLSTTFRGGLVNSSQYGLQMLGGMSNVFHYGAWAEGYTGLRAFGNTSAPSGGVFPYHQPAGVYGAGYYGVYGSGEDAGAGVYGKTSTGAGLGVIGISTGPNAAGVYGQNNNAAGAGVFGNSASGVGVYGNSSAIGVYAVGTPYGVYSTASTSTGTGVYGSGFVGVNGTGSFDDNNGIGVFGQGRKGVKGYGSDNVASGAGVYGYGFYGVQGVSPTTYRAFPQYTGVYGNGFWGVYGEGNTTNASAYGVYGYGYGGVRGDSNQAVGYGVEGENAFGYGALANGSGGLRADAYGGARPAINATSSGLNYAIAAYADYGAVYAETSTSNKYAITGTNPNVAAGYPNRGGVYGDAERGYGVVGHTTASTMDLYDGAGVAGYSDGWAPGVYAYAVDGPSILADNSRGGNHYAIYANASGGSTGIYATADGADAIYATETTGAVGEYAINAYSNGGTAISGLTDGSGSAAGVYGYNPNGYGVYGLSGSTGGHGVVGSNPSGNGGLFITGSNSYYALTAQAASSNGKALNVSGNMTLTGSLNNPSTVFYINDQAASGGVVQVGSASNQANVSIPQGTLSVVSNEGIAHNTIYAENTASATATNVVYAYQNGVKGTAVYGAGGDVAVQGSGNNYGVVGDATSSGADGYGVKGIANTKAGVVGVASVSTTSAIGVNGSAYTGVAGTGNSTEGAGVYGTGYYGVVGFSTTGTGGYFYTTTKPLYALTALNTKTGGNGLLVTGNSTFTSSNVTVAGKRVWSNGNCYWLSQASGVGNPLTVSCSSGDTVVSGGATCAGTAPRVGDSSPTGTYDGWYCNCDNTAASYLLTCYAMCCPN